MVWIHRRYTDEHWKVGSANVILSSCFCVVMVTVHPSPSGSSRGTKARKLRITNNHNGTYQKTRWQKVSCKNRLNIPKWPKCYITSMEKSTIQSISWLLRHSKPCRAHHFPRQLQHLSRKQIASTQGALEWWCAMEILAVKDIWENQRWNLTLDSWIYQKTTFYAPSALRDLRSLLLSLISKRSRA